MSFGKLRSLAPPAGDALLAAVLACLAAAQVVASDTGSRPIGLLLVLVVGAAAPLAWRRVFPLASALAVSVFMALVLAGEHPPFLVGNLFAVVISLYSVGAHVAWARVAAVPLAIAVIAPTLGEPRSTPLALWFVVVAATLSAPWLLGRELRRQRERADELEALATKLEAQQERAGEAAALEERSRIARELHDVVAHSISVIAVQAAGAEATLDTDPEDSRESLATIEDASKQTQVEMARMLHMLRGRDAPEVSSAGLESLPALVREVEASGTRVHLSLEGDAAVPRAHDLNAYRIIQEALTNVRKHAGPGAAAEVSVRRSSEEVAIVVRDDGRGPSRATDGGHGLVGMRERAHLFGGSIVAEEAPGGGFEVRALIPTSSP